MTSRLCPYCQKEKVWVFSGQKLKDGSKIYIDQATKKWAGKRCPDCERSRVKTALKYTPQQKKYMSERLKDFGYDIVSDSFPPEVEKDGRRYKVGILQGIADESLIAVDDEQKDDCDLYLVVFNSLRVLTPAKVKSLQRNV